MADFYLNSGSGVVERANSAANALGAKVVIARADVSTNYSVVRKWVLECTTAGTTGAAVPTWPASVTQDVTTVTDGTVTWTCRKPGYSSGTTADWTFAAIYADYVAQALAAGDRLYVSNNHAESVAAAITLTFAGTSSAPNYVLCVSDAAAPPTATATTATITTTGTANLSISGCVYLYGVSLFHGTGGSSTSFTLSSQSGSSTVVDTCVLKRVAYGGNALSLGPSSGTTGGHSVELRNTNLSFSGTSQYVACNGNVSIIGGAMAAGSLTPASGIFNPDIKVAGISIQGFDFSGFAATVSPFKATATYGACLSVMRNCKMPVGWSGNLVSGTISVKGQRFELHNCDAADTNYRLWVEDLSGTIRSETVVVRTGGASDGITPLSWKMTSNANALFPMLPLNSPEIVKWNETIGTPVTVAIEVVTDGVTLTNAECWLDVQYLGTSGFPLSLFANDAAADIFATPVNQTTSTATWTTTGLTTPVKQSLSVTFTPQEKGFIHAVVKLAKTSTTVYVDPLLTVA